MSITGYTEYHASQVELMQLLGANFVGEIICFSMNDNINTQMTEKIFVHLRQIHILMH